jgi:hypothetical protein
MYCNTLRICNLRKMVRLCTKPVCLSKPVKLADNMKDASLLCHLSHSVNYESVMLYSTGLKHCKLMCFKLKKWENVARCPLLPVFACKSLLTQENSQLFSCFKSIIFLINIPANLVNVKIKYFRKCLSAKIIINFLRICFWGPLSKKKGGLYLCQFCALAKIVLSKWVLKNRQRYLSLKNPSIAQFLPKC